MERCWTGHRDTLDRMAGGNAYRDLGHMGRDTYTGVQGYIGHPSRVGVHMYRGCGWYMVYNIPLNKIFVLGNIHLKLGR